MRKSHRLLAVPVALAMILAACSDDKSSSSDTKAGASDTTAAASDTTAAAMGVSQALIPISKVRVRFGRQIGVSADACEPHQQLGGH